MPTTDLAPYRRAPRHYGYVARSVHIANGAIRPTRRAAGMTYTASRSAHSLDRLALQMSLFGTLDVLRGGLHAYFVTDDCACCGAKRRGKVRLNESGARRLQRLRAQRRVKA